MIRTLTVSDLTDIEDTFFNSFSAEEAPITFHVIRDLITESAKQKNYCIGCELDGSVVSAIGFSPVYFDRETNIPASIFIIKIANF